VVLDGFDLVTLAVVFPVLLSEHLWGLTAGTASAIAMIGLVGMTIGALAIGTVAETIGRRKALMISVVCFSLFTLLSAAAPSALAFTTLRFLAGLGLTLVPLDVDGPETTVEVGLVRRQAEPQSRSTRALADWLREATTRESNDRPGE
jgi:MFS family permease